MVKRELKDCLPYDAAKHFNMTISGCRVRRVRSAKFWLGMSHFSAKRRCRISMNPN